jgi:hypothetical protein
MSVKLVRQASLIGNRPPVHQLITPLGIESGWLTLTLLGRTLNRETSNSNSAFNC